MNENKVKDLICYLRTRRNLFKSGYKSITNNLETYVNYPVEFLRKISGDCERHYYLKNDIWQLGASQAIKEIIKSKIVVSP